jgi:uncharacterized protein (DUF433 family)
MSNDTMPPSDWKDGEFLREFNMDDIENVVRAFSTEHVVHLTGLTKAQLTYWDKTGFFEPQYAGDDRRVHYSRVYSFKDVVGLRTLSILRGKHGVSLPHLRDVARELSTYSKTPWADIQLKVWNRKVQFDEPETGKTRGVIDGQYVLLPLISVIEDVRREAEKLRQREPSQIGKLEKHRDVAHNALVIAGTRIPVSTVLAFVEDGYSVADIIREYPTLTEADIEAAIQHRKAGLAA